MFVAAAGSLRAQQPAPLHYGRDVRPILAAKCFTCHGPDDGTREADLRLDRRDAAIAKRDGHAAIVPGRPDDSELVRRITTDDADERMPPADSPLTLTDAQRDTLRRWIAEGAEYDEHWAFIPPRRPPLPAVRNAAWPKSPLDTFVLSKLEQEGLAPSPEATPLALVRRLHLDLIGLPPDPDSADAWATRLAPTPGGPIDDQAYQELVDQLLASPRYGERWARTWLDLARYSDTNGYEKDRPRSIWPYRDWVVRALNDDLSFDQFTIEQLAGDMLPGATPDQRIATGFHRNTMLNEEGGIDPLEFRYLAMIDRVSTTGLVWMGLTLGCAQCHSHKYDPVTQTEFYRLMALLNNADEPDLSVPNPATERQRAEIQAEIERLERGLADQFPLGDEAGQEGDESTRRAAHLQQRLDAWLAERRPGAARWTTLRPESWETNLPWLERLEDDSLLSSGDITKRDVFTIRYRPGTAAPMTALRLEALPDERLPAGGPGRCYYEGRQGDFFLSELRVRANGEPVQLVEASHSYGKISIGSGSAAAENVLDGDGSTGWSTAEGEGRAHQLVVNFAQPVPAGDTLEVELLFERHFAASLGRFRVAVTTADESPTPARASLLPVEIEALLARDSSTWNDDERERVRREFLAAAPELADARKQIEALRKRLPRTATTLVMSERPPENPRPTHRHHRGEYLQPREAVVPGVPAAFGELGGDEQSRLGLARWLVSDRNPLVARVAVNRAWGAIFGAGLVRTDGDYGVMAPLPTHPELIDWLAVDFQEAGWSLKRLHRQLVTSATYRQDSRVDAALQARDPQNQFWARGTRFRVDAELVRDLMLAASGRMSTKQSGPSVYPPQPAIVTALAYGETPWPTSQGEDRYRRSLYTFSKRTAPFAAFTVFDAPTGENCIARRDRADTPLQALTLLNDELYVELSQAIARRAMDETTADGNAGEAEATATRLFRLLLTRPPTDSELASLVAYQHAQHERLERGELKASDLTGGPDDPEWASWSMVARAVMNLDEAISRE